MDLTYRTELRTLNDTNFARFEALLDSRFARADLQLERQLNERFGGFEQRMESRFDKFTQESEARLVTIEIGFTAIREELRLGLATQLRWMIGLWIATTAGLLALLAR